MHNIDAVVAHWYPGLRLFMEGNIAPMLKRSAEHAWFGFELSYLASVAQCMGTDDNILVGIFDLLLTRTCQAVNCSEGKVCSFLEQRFGHMLWKTSWKEAMRVVDESAKALTERQIILLQD